MAHAAAVLDALGDPTRGSVLEQRISGPLPVGVQADRLPISRPAVRRSPLGTAHPDRADPVTDTDDQARWLAALGRRAWSAAT